MPVAGILASYSSSDAFASYFEPAFHQGLKETGYVEGRNVTIEYRWGRNGHGLGDGVQSPPLLRSITCHCTKPLPR
jgi:hypothetical protein